MSKVRYICNGKLILEKDCDSFIKVVEEGQKLHDLPIVRLRKWISREEAEKIWPKK